ncbi:MAG: hypothetical protein JSW47_08870 [Phycisphaerales bacterium]|nr:MAG: hypothetical protein JSW47_08870 [Phycisphaerales bacterium]
MKTTGIALMIAAAISALAMSVVAEGAPKESNTFRLIPIPKREHGYRSMESVVIRTETDLAGFLKRVRRQGGWNKRRAFEDAIKKAKVDLGKEALVFLRHTEGSGSVRVTFETPILRAPVLTCRITRKVPEMGTADMAYYCFALAVSKSDVGKVTLHVQGKKAIELSVGQGQSKEKTLPIKGEVFTIKGRTAFLILPEMNASGSPIPWVWYAPTLKELPGNAEKWMFERFLKNGVAIAGADVGESYGSPGGRAIYSALYKELVEKRGLAKQACLLARSRGGLMLYNWAAENPRSVACIAGIYPVCNLSSYPGLARACRAYGMTDEQLAAKLTEHNPIDRLAPLAELKVPIFHIHGDSDRVVPLDENSGELRKRYEKLGGEMTLEVVKGQGHNMWHGWFHSQGLVDFVITHAKKDKPNQAIDGDTK